MKHLLSLPIMFFAMINIAFAQQPKVYFENSVMTNFMQPDWSFINYSENQKEILAFYRNLDNKTFYLSRFDTEFNVKTQSEIKMKSTSSKTSTILNVHENGSQIHVITEEGNDIIHYTFNYDNLQNTDKEILFTNTTHSPGKIATEVSWSANGEYMAVVACDNRSEHDPLKYTNFNYYIYLYDKDIHLLNHIQFPYMQYKVACNKFCRPTWTITDNGEVVYAALHYTPTPKKIPEFGVSGCKIEARVITKDNCKIYEVPNISSGGCLWNYLTYATGNIAKYDGEKMLVFFANVLFQYDLKNNTAKSLCRFDIYIGANTSTGLSNYIDDGNGGFIMNRGRIFVWIKKDPLESYWRSWGNSTVQQGNAMFFPRYDAYSSEATFLHERKLYHIDNVDNAGFASKKYRATQLVYYDENGNYDVINITSDAKNDLSFHHLSGSRYLIWEPNVKIGEQYRQRLGFFEFK